VAAARCPAKAPARTAAMAQYRPGFPGRRNARVSHVAVKPHLPPLPGSEARKGRGEGRRVRAIGGEIERAQKRAGRERWERVGVLRVDSVRRERGAMLSRRAGKRTWRKDVQSEVHVLERRTCERVLCAEKRARRGPEQTCCGSLVRKSARENMSESAERESGD